MYVYIGRIVYSYPYNVYDVYAKKLPGTNIYRAYVRYRFGTEPPTYLPLPPGNLEATSIEELKRKIKSIYPKFIPV